jgi:outer membrane protein TolC
VKKLVVFGCAVVLGVNSYSLSIDEYMDRYKKNNNLYKASELTVEASQEKVESADLELSPLLTLDYLKNNDQSLPSQLGNERDLEQYGVGIAKKFSTGTQVKVEAKTYQFENATHLPDFDQYSTGLVGVSLRQSLWKDFFGFGTRTRIERTRKVSELEAQVAELEKKALLIEAEVLFWDYAFAKEDLKLKKENLKRAQRLFGWTDRRLSNGISDRADMLNAKSLVAIRELQIINAENDLKTYEVKMRQALDLKSDEALPVLNVNLDGERPYVRLLRNKKNIIKIDHYLSMLESEVKTLVSNETTDSLKPDLSVFGSYNTTSYNREYQKAVSDMTKSDYPQSTVGVNLTWMLGGASKSSLINAMEKEINSAELKALKKRADGLLAWDEFIRQYDVTLQQSKILDRIVEIQKTRLNAENDRFSKGRSITATVITAESESADSESNALKAKMGLRKFEASSQLYISLDDLKQ